MSGVAARQRLRVVEPDEKTQQKQSVAKAAESGDRRALLVSMRERIARTVSDPDCPPRDLAALTRRLQDISKEIEAMDLRAKREGDSSVVDDEEWDEEAL